MNANSKKVSDVFSNGGNIHYVLPHFQREYTWEKSNWKTLWEDLAATYSEYVSGQNPEHFMGSLVVILDGTVDGLIPAFKLVDGQQRLTSISLLLCALRWIMKGKDTALESNLESMLCNRNAAGDAYFKLFPTIKHGDRAVFTSLVKTGSLPTASLPIANSNISAAYEYFYQKLDFSIQSNTVDPQKLFLVLLNCLQVVVIELNQQESPYKIFESLNGKGKPLSQADLVRNYIAMKLPAAIQEQVFTSDWSKIEDMLQEQRLVARQGELTSFLRHCLAVDSGVLCNFSHVYARFRDRMETKTQNELVLEVTQMHQLASIYNKLLRPSAEKRSHVKEALERLNALELSSAYPFLLSVYKAQHDGVINDQEFEGTFAVLENYLVRRFLAGEQSNYLTKMFPMLWGQIDKANFSQSLRQVLVSKNYPSDMRIQQSLLTRPLYDIKTKMVLERVNLHLHIGTGGYSSLSSNSTLEHIMPQTLSAQWKQDIGANWEQVHRDYLHTLGNLTIVSSSWNSALSNSDFSSKKSKLDHNALLLNSSYFGQQLPVWDEMAIRQRAGSLTKHILNIWPALV